jgi:hypothetical protein
MILEVNFLKCLVITNQVRLLFKKLPPTQTIIGRPQQIHTTSVAEMAIKAIEKHDQNSFVETIVLNEITKFNENTGEKYVAGKNVLYIKGEYAFKWFAHCKTIEMWVEVEK